jgi:hypothetical protein
MSTYPQTPSLSRRFTTIMMTDAGTAGTAPGSVFFTPGYRGKIKKITAVSPVAITGANNVLTASIGTTAVTGGVVTMLLAASAAGDIFSATPTAANTFSPTDYIKVVSDGGATNAVLPVAITLELEAT